MKFSSTLALTAALGMAEARKCHQNHDFFYHHDDALKDNGHILSESKNMGGGFGNSAMHMTFDEHGEFCTEVKVHMTDVESDIGFYNGRTGAGWSMWPAKYEKDATNGIFDFTFFYNVKTHKYEVFLNETDLWYHGVKDFGDKNAQIYAHLKVAGEYVEVPHHNNWHRKLETC